jgi:hypothetical protein
LFRALLGFGLECGGEGGIIISIKGKESYLKNFRKALNGRLDGFHLFEIWMKLEKNP